MRFPVSIYKVGKSRKTPDTNFCTHKHMYKHAHHTHRHMHLTYIERHIYTHVHKHAYKSDDKNYKKVNCLDPPHPHASLPFIGFHKGIRLTCSGVTQIHPVECQDYFVLSDISLPLFILPVTRASSRLLLLFIVQLFCLLSLLLTFQYCSKIDQ